MTNRFFAGQTNYIEEMNALDGETGDHIADATGAHAATAISNTPAGNIAATTVQAAINELDTEKLSASATTLPASFTASSLTSVGTLTALTVSGQASFAAGSAAAPSVKVGAGNDGLYSLGSGVLGLAASGRVALRLETVPSSVNYLYGYANSTGGAPVLRALGSDANVSLIFSSQGTGSVDVFTNGATVGQFRVNHVANSVNIIQAAGAATGGAPSFAVGGTDTNIPFAYYTKGTGTHLFFANGGLQMLIGAPASSVNYWQFFGAAAAGSLAMYAAGADTNIGISHYTKGIGTHSFFTNSNAEQFRVAHTANAVNYAQITGSATGLSVVYGAGGSDTNVATVVTSKGAAKVGFYTNNGGSPALIITHTASAVNYWDFTGAATGNGVRVDATGSDSGVNAFMVTKGSGVWNFCTGGSAGNRQLQIGHTASAVNYWNIAGAVTGGLNTLTTQGSDTNIGAYLATKGSGSWRFATGVGDQFRIMHVASAVNFFSAYGGGTGNGPTLYADGSDAAINANYSLKGSGSHVFYTGSTSVVQLVVNHTASTVNWPVITGAATGNAVTISTGGSDTNRDIAITPGGAGVLRFGTHSAIAAETVTGYITIKDSAGNTRKLAVLS